MDNMVKDHEKILPNSEAKSVDPDVKKFAEDIKNGSEHLDLAKQTQAKLQ
jgi:hypothetical protein